MGYYPFHVFLTNFIMNGVEIEPAIYRNSFLVEENLVQIVQGLRFLFKAVLNEISEKVLSVTHV